MGKPPSIIGDPSGEPTLIEVVRQDASFDSSDPTLRSKSPTMFKAVIRAVGVKASEAP